MPKSPPFRASLDILKPLSNAKTYRRLGRNLELRFLAPSGQLLRVEDRPHGLTLCFKTHENPMFHP